MTTKLAIHANKGGVYKTSTTVSLAINLADRNYKVLIVDCDSQNNVSLQFKNFEYDENKTLYNLITDADYKHVDKYIFKAKENIDVITNSFDSLNIDYNIYTQPEKYNNVLELFSFIDNLDNYDFILFDLASAYSLYNLNAIAVSDYCIMLTELEVASIKGLLANFEIIQNFNTKILGVLKTKISRNTRLYSALNNQLIENLNSANINVFNAEIEKRLEQANSLYFNEQNISMVYKSSKTAREYNNLTLEILKELNMNFRKEA